MAAGGDGRGLAALRRRTGSGVKSQRSPPMRLNCKGLLVERASLIEAKDFARREKRDHSNALSVDPVARIVESASKLTLLTQFRVKIDTFETNLP